MSAAPALESPWLVASVAASRARIAEECRAAGLAFLAGTAASWGKRELATWLTRDYALATVYAGARPSLRALPAPRALEPLAIAQVSRGARWTVLSELEGAALPRGAARFVDDALARGTVAPVHAIDGLTWAPVDLPGARLRTRVLSLFAADALARPDDYASVLHVCPRCEAVSFDPDARRRGGCAWHFR